MAVDRLYIYRKMSNASIEQNINESGACSKIAKIGTKELEMSRDLWF